MSEYQDYRWSCVDRSLSRNDAKEVNKLSSHITVTSTSAQVNYSYGDFKHDAIKVLGNHFDIHTYEANWGSQSVAFRFDIGAVDEEALHLFTHTKTVTVTRTERSVIFEAGYWEENFLDDSWIPDDYPSYQDDRFHRIYRDILNGDFRALFLLWLKTSSHHEPDRSNPAAPVPPGLAQLHSDHTELIEFIGLDPDVLTAAARFSADSLPSSNPISALESLLDKLSPERMRHHLSALLSENEQSVTRALKAELRSFLPKRQNQCPGESIPFKDIAPLAATIKTEREQREKDERERIHNAHLERLAKLETKIWSSVEKLISEKTPKSYDLAVDYLRALRHLYEHRGMTDQFVENVRKIVNTFPTLSGMKSRMKDAGHLSAAPVERPRYGMTTKSLDALMKTLDVLGDPDSVEAIHAAQKGKSTNRLLDLDDENFGL